MDKGAQFLKQIIESKHASIRAFSQYFGIPYTTVFSVLKRGVLNASVGTISKICNSLNLSTDDVFTVLCIDSVHQNESKKLDDINDRVQKANFLLDQISKLLKFKEVEG